MIRAFGDESIGSGAVCYAIAAFREESVVHAEGLLVTAKESIGISPDVSLHCPEF
jgi:hypothetical protein